MPVACRTFQRAALLSTIRSQGTRCTCFPPGSFAVGLLLVRRQSSRRTSGDANTEAVAFRSTQADAVVAFQQWAKQNTPFSSPPKVQNVTSTFLPFWVFISDVYHPELPRSRRGVSSAAMQVYAGDSFPRSMMEVVKTNPALRQPFSSRLLDIGPRCAGAAPAAVDVEPFHLYEASAWGMARAAHVAHEQSLHPEANIDAARMRFDNVESRRVLMPAHVVEYTYLLQTFRVFVNGATRQAYGIQQQSAFGFMASLAKGFETSNATGLLRFLDRLHIDPRAALLLLNFLGGLFRPLVKFMLWPPFFVGTMLAVGGFALRRGTAGHRAQRASFAEWEEERRRLRAEQAAMTDDWRFQPMGRSAADRQTERDREDAEADWRWQGAGFSGPRAEQQQQKQQTRAGTGAGSAGASAQHAWSAFWQQAGASARAEQEAAQRQAYEAEQQRRQQQERQQAQARASQQQQQQRASDKKRPPYVDPSDYYALLGLAELGPGRATTADVQKGFRRELMKYHPDHQLGSGLDAAACSERTRQIIAAYGVLRDESKRQQYDATYRRR